MSSGIGLNQIVSEGNGADNTSNGVGPQMQLNESHQLRTTGFLNNFTFSSSYLYSWTGKMEIENLITQILKASLRMTIN